MESTKLCKIAEKYGVDKCPKINHYYTSAYNEYLCDMEPKKFLEIGIGNHNLMSPIVGNSYEYGASLRMWKEYFPNCQIYGCDILEDVIFQDERIITRIADQSSVVSLEDMMSDFGSMDIILDDGSHIEEHQILSFSTLWKYINIGGYYIIEDISINRLDEMSNLYKQFVDCKIKYIHKHHRDSQGFIIFEKK